MLRFVTPDDIVHLGARRSYMLDLISFSRGVSRFDLCLGILGCCPDMRSRIDRGTEIVNRSKGSLLRCVLVLGLGRGLLGQVAILRNRFPWQDNWLIACGPTVIRARTRWWTRIRTRGWRFLYGLCGLNLRLRPIAALVSLAATSATAATASSPWPRSLRRIPVRSG